MSNFSWQQQLLSVDEEYLTPHMKILILQWHNITAAMKAKKQVDQDGTVWTTLKYISVCCGCHYKTTQRTLSKMKKAGYAKVHYKNVGTPQQIMGIRLLPCVYKLDLTSLPTTNKGRNQRKFICSHCGSSNVEAIPTFYKLVCQECGGISHVDHEGRRLA